MEREENQVRARIDFGMDFEIGHGFQKKLQSFIAEAMYKNRGKGVSWA
jgi:hypothetical protein